MSSLLLSVQVLKSVFHTIHERVTTSTLKTLLIGFQIMHLLRGKMDFKYAFFRWILYVPTYNNCYNQVLCQFISSQVEAGSCMYCKVTLTWVRVPKKEYKYNIRSIKLLFDVIGWRNVKYMYIFSEFILYIFVRRVLILSTSWFPAPPRPPPAACPSCPSWCGRHATRSRNRHGSSGSVHYIC